MTESATVVTLKTVDVVLGLPWMVCLDELLIRCPQKLTEYGPNYIIEGGAAISLLNPNKRLAPNDVDLLIFDEEDNRAIKSQKFNLCDIHDPKRWFCDRNIPFTDNGLRYLQRSFLQVPLTESGFNVFVLNPPILYASKIFHFRELRPKDLFDLMILNVGKGDIDTALNGLRGEL
ncbi:hypothetical protein COV58_01420 [Candidatus Roizmanbacteria bacterium CG11_big_fil_rev_8_21_14_0_20_36_8]|uniref:Uncharacterized protein n=2 Tax=Candidatus Roizmaniibacteriota TaxID=1752723 RepID=A0A2M6IV46_9BACT|nr:MAG: hypothetical protein COV58_01420 [Candidatus Roizmanbacteria bacterium CG11_big_fil_rev_8_21_14_0_20_36_8]PIZ66089.1 MAG: hypothetical protein COY14_01000 [Candidatus Roizmanbacteria bacterium CG_4_10_14_0_2_um_filter_36_9]